MYSYALAFHTTEPGHLAFGELVDGCRQLGAHLLEGTHPALRTYDQDGNITMGKPIPAEDLIYYGLEYKFVTQHIIGEITLEEMHAQLATAIHQFAKRQMTWFRGMERKGIRIHWTNV